jgi:hypothetical protein
MKSLRFLILGVTFFFAVTPTTSAFALSFSLNPPKEVEVKSQYILQKELETIDNQLESLLNLRDYYSSKMMRYRNRATRYEFQGENPSQSKTLTVEADKIQGVISQIDEEIAKLEKEKEELLSK